MQSQVGHDLDTMLYDFNAIQEEARRPGRRIAHLEARSCLPAVEVVGTAVHRSRLGCRQDVRRRTRSQLVYMRFML